MKTPRRRPPAPRAGFTVVELLLALAVTGLVMGAVLMMLGSTIEATRSDRDTREAIVRRQAAIARLTAETRGNAALLDAAGDALVFWVGDPDGDGLPRVSELKRIAWDADAQAILVSAADPALPPGSDTVYGLGSDFDAVASALAGGAAFPERTLLRGVSAFVSTTDAADPLDARVLEIALTLDRPSGEDTAVVVSSFRVSLSP